MATSNLQSTPICCYGNQQRDQLTDTTGQRSHPNDDKDIPVYRSSRLRRRRDAVDLGRETPIPPQTLDSLLQVRAYEGHDDRDRSPSPQPINTNRSSAATKERYRTKEDASERPRTTKPTADRRRTMQDTKDKRRTIQETATSSRTQAETSLKKLRWSEHKLITLQVLTGLLFFHKAFPLMIEA